MISCISKLQIFQFFQHGVFNENEMKFYAAEVILGLEHMHR